MNAVKTVFSDATNLLCRFHIDKNVKAKCKTLVSQKNAWDYVMEVWKQSFQAYFDDAKDSSQESRFKKVSRIKESFNQESRFKRRLKICKNFKKSIKISIKIFFQRKD
ncbi:hypothetical protein DD596_25605 [Enterobacter cloacae complex sp. 4DZ3-28B]|nr:hypothetical protein DD596_25605 [Enterobacter cloacae complex sp. 4DZ3-28B]